MENSQFIADSHETASLVDAVAREELERRGELDAAASTSAGDWLRSQHPVDFRADWDEVEAAAGLFYETIGERDAMRAAERDRKAAPRGTVAIQTRGRTLHVSRTAPTPVTGEKGGGIRGQVTEFSAQSRRRMLNMVHRLDRESPAQFVTFTYHKTDPHPDAAKGHLRAWIKRLARKYSGVRWSLVWRMELQSRGVIHFHCIVFGLKWISWDWVKRTWHEITGETSEHHRAIGAWVKALTNARAVSNYCAKYCAKPSTDEERESLGRWETCGRIWGIRNRRFLPLVPFDVELDIGWRRATALISLLMKEIAPGVQYVPASVALYASDPLARLRRLGFDP